MNQNPYLLIYLAGSVLAVPLFFISIGLGYAIKWVIRANIASKNLKKLLRPDNKTWKQKVLIFLGACIFDVVLSWIGVFFRIGHILFMILSLLRDAFAPVPEEIKILEYPLKNNPMLSKEAVWAYSVALCIKTGEEAKKTILMSIQEARDIHPSFNYQDALSQLDNLKVISTEDISSVKEILAMEGHFHAETEGGV